MATGDDALAAGMDIVDGAAALANTLDTEINKSRDYIAQRTSAVTPIGKGGTGATSAAAARSALGITPASIGAAEAVHTEPWASVTGKPSTFPPSAHTHPWSQITGEPATYPPAPHTHSASDITSGTLGQSRLAANSVGYAQIEPGAVAYASLHPALARRLEDGIWDTSIRTSGHFYTDGAIAATSNYVVAYINGDGRIAKGASSERYKKYISDVEPDTLGDLFPQLKRFQMREGDGTWRYGYIAERLAEHPDQERFVVYQTDDTGALVKNEAGQHVPDSIDFIGLLLAQVAQLNARVAQLEARP